ncbi:MAG: HipA domain-containing protein [Gammaproteobacteria bacterium]|nr:HipA domain-containing protein [Gammaproteobacteria bacterium]MBQ0841284.1 HipA domain-containing protein [Gammaproteobacteria bacterium]
MSIEYCKVSLKKLSGKQSKPGYNNNALKALFGSTKVKPCLPFSRSEFFQRSRQNVQGMSISGVQQKLSLKKNEQHELIATVEGGEYILKPSPETYPNAAENEHAAMQVSRLMGIDTAQCGLVTFDGGELAYITKRFDRLDDGSKLHQEDLMQCFDLPSDDKYNKTYEEAGKLIGEVTNGKQSVVLDFVRRVILAYATGNDDLHLKNVSVQRRTDNTSRFYDKLSPSYDCLFCDAFRTDEPGMGQLALGLLYDPDDGDEEFTDMHNCYGYYTGYDFLELGRRLGLPEKPIRAFIAKLKTNEKKIADMINHSYMPDDMKTRAIKLVESHTKALQVVDASEQ